MSVGGELAAVFGPVSLQGEYIHNFVDAAGGRPLRLTGPPFDEANPTWSADGRYLVPDGHFFMMGDNRDSSYDGRYWGFLPRENVRGRPLVVYFSYDPNSWRSIPFLTAVRWGRIFTAPH